jgi:hypothetical protein
VSLYAIPTMFLPGEVKFLQEDSSQLRDLKGRYKTWLEKFGVEAFGQPLDHGDSEASQGDPAAELQLANELLAAMPPPLTDDKALELVTQIRAAYAEARALDPYKLPPGQFQVKLERARHEHAALEELLGFVVGLRDHLAGATA